MLKLTMTPGLTNLHPPIILNQLQHASHLHAYAKVAVSPFS
jgi:hypothetical protein